jgi:nitrous oxidase accessory protein NosD
MKRIGLTLGLAAIALAVLAAPAFAKTRNVWPGQSIQKAVNRAHPGDTVLVHHGTYHQTVVIRKNDINLVGHHVTLLPPAHPTGLCAQVSAPEVSGICVLGNFDSSFNAIPPAARDNSISGFRVEHFTGEGIFLYNVAGTSITHDIAAWNGDYGIVGFVQHGGRYLWNVSHDNAAPGFYLGDSPHANYVIAHNVSFNNQFGIFVRHSAHGVVRDNQVWGNCIGVFFLDDGQPGGEHNLTLSHNKSWANDKACAAGDDGPAISGIGVLLLGAQHSTVHGNTIRDNVASGPSPFSGGLLLLSSIPFGGTHNAAFDTVTGNHLSGNAPFDVIWDGAGTGNVFSGNTCSTSSPSWICS